MATAVWYIWLPHCSIANKPLNHMWTPKLHLCVDLHQNLTNPSRNLYASVSLPIWSLLLSTIIHPIHFIFGGCVAGDYIKCSAKIEVVQQSSSSILAKNGSPLAKFPFFLTAVCSTLPGSKDTCVWLSVSSPTDNGKNLPFVRFMLSLVSW